MTHHQDWVANQQQQTHEQKANAPWGEATSPRNSPSLHGELGSLQVSNYCYYYSQRWRCTYTAEPAADVKRCRR